MLKIENSMKLIIESRSKNESFARQAVAAFAAQLDPTVSEVNDIKTAVSEAVTNAIIHGYRDTFGYITITVQLMQDGIRISIKDQGCGIPDVAQAMEPAFTTGDEERSGMGFTIMKSFMDKLSIRSKIGKGTTVTMCKNLSPRCSRMAAYHKG